MWRQILYAFIPLAILVAIPVLMRPSADEKGSGGATGGDRVVIITPHSESLRYEFGRAFREHYREKYGREVTVEWRTPGGTSDIVRFIADRYESAFKTEWLAQPGNEWSHEIAVAFTNPKATPGGKVSETAINARKQFMQSNAGIGIDLFFGGGQYDHNRHAEKGYAVDAGIARLHPEWFNDNVIPQRFSGEIFYDPAGRYYGTCLSSFGICWNIDRVKELNTTITGWADLADRRFFQQIAIADPTKAGSVNKCFEMIIQQQMSEAVKRDSLNGLNQGWTNGINLIKRIAANTRYVTDSASKVPHDTATGAAAAGICIDFYGRSEAEWTAMQNKGQTRMEFLSPINGTSVSADPIQLLRGAPNPQTAIDFIEFVLSVEGQKLWNYRIGTPDGPRRYVLRRLPIRKDMYTPEHLQYMTDKDVNLYESCAGFVYHPEWTAKYFNLLRVMIKCMILNPLPELQDAWQEIIKAGGPQAVPLAMAKFNELPSGYQDIEASRNALTSGPVTGMLKAQREWSEFARKKYCEAAELARAGK